MPARFPFPLPTTRLWVARTLDAARYPPDVQPFQVVARLRPGVTPATALAALESDSAALGDAVPALAGRTPHIESLRAGLNFADDILSIGAVVVGAATLLVLVAACANISSLMLGRAVGRSREVAVRTAIGAGRFRLVRQFLVESLALAAVGAAAGLALAAVGVRGLDGLIDADIFRAAPLAIDGRAAVIAVGLAVGSALLFGLAPAFQFARTRVSQALRQEGTSATASRRSLRLQSAFVVAQVAVSVVLLVGTIVAARSVAAMSRLDLGFAPDAVQTLQMSLPAARYPDADARARFHRDLRQRLAGATGVAGVATVDYLPLNYESRVDRVDAVGSAVPPASAGADAQVITVSAGYFDVLQTPLVAGRDFEAADTAARVPVAIVNRTFAARHWPGRDAVGGTFRLDDRPAVYTVVGVVGDTRQIDLSPVDRAQVFLAQGQTPRSYLRVLVRASGDPVAVLPLIAAAVREVDPLLPVNDPRTLRQVVEGFLLPQRALRVVLLVIGGVSLLLALIGIYGIVSCHVADRTREMGIRAALGASRRRLLGDVLRRGVILAIAGTAAGLAIGVISVSGVRGVLPGIEPGGPAAYVGLAVLVIAVAAVAGLGPARRAARTNPVVAMK
jgi:predicted permease